MLKLMYITNQPEVALIAEKNGVDRIWIDLETLGKEERQKNIDSVKSHHKISDITKISKLLTTSKMLVRINPWNPNSGKEIDSVILAGAEILMLPMWKSVNEVKSFINKVNGRAKTLLLLETKEAEECLDDVLKLKGIDEIHIGLNDLHLSYHLKFMFELLTNGTVERICRKIKKAGIPYGFGGIARLCEGVIPAEKIIGEHYRLGSSMAILSRSFCNQDKIQNLNEFDNLFNREMKLVKFCETQMSHWQNIDFNNNSLEVESIVNRFISKNN